MADLLADLPNRIGALATKWAAGDPTRPALIDASGMWTYGELPRVVDATKAWLKDNNDIPALRRLVIEHLAGVERALIAQAKDA